MSVDKYSSMFSRQMEAIVYIHPSRELVPKLSGACPCCVTLLRDSL